MPSASTEVARAYVTLAPRRMVWGSDWPHPTEKDDAKPDDALLFDLLSQWAPNESGRRDAGGQSRATLWVCLISSRSMRRLKFLMMRLRSP